MATNSTEQLIPKQEQQQEEEENLLAIEPYNNNGDSKKERKRKSRPSDENDDRASKRVSLSISKPSYTLKLGSRKLRVESRARLTRLLRSLVSQRSWTEACGVLSVLLKSTSSDSSHRNNRFKYSALIEVLAQLGGDYFSQGRIKSVYDIWMRKIGSIKNQQDESRFAVRLEYIVYSLTQGNINDAHQAALWLMQESDFGNDMVENLVLGLTFHQLWLSTIPKELLYSEADEFEGSTLGHSRDLIAYSGECVGANSMDEASNGFLCDSASSVRNDKPLAVDVDGGFHGGTLASALGIIKVENHLQDNEPLENSAISTANETSASAHDNISTYTSTLSALDGLNPSLFPIRLPQSLEDDGENLYHLHMKLLNNYYKSALKFLSVAVHSSPPALEALLPYIQLLLIGCKVDEALSELDKLCRSSSALLPIRLKACILEHFDRSNEAVLSTCFEDIIKKDPTCCQSLEKLITIHRNGTYSNESLLEMVALHIDATYPKYETWKELASCFLRCSENEEDRISVCQNGNEGRVLQRYSVTNPQLFTDGESGENWKLRCRWWSNRHFNCNMLASDMAAGNSQLAAYKAACASHMYEPEFAYIVDVCDYLEKQNESDLLLFLKRNIHNSIQMYLSFKQNREYCGETNI